MRGEEKYRRSHRLGAFSQKFRAHSERIQSGYIADTERTPSGYRADTECQKSASAEETLVRSE